MAETMLEAMEEADEIRSALMTLRRISGLPVAFGGAVLGQETLRISELTGATTDSLRGLSVTAGNGLGGKVLVLGRPYAVTDYANARTISHEYDAAVTEEGLRSMVAVPVVVGRTVRAVLYGALRHPLPLGDRVVSAVRAAGRELEQSIAKRDEAYRLMDMLNTAEGNLVNASVWEEVRQIHAELRALAQESADPGVRARLQQVCARLASASDTDDPRGAPAASCPQLLTPREVDVLAQVATGCTNAEVGRRLGLRTETVKSYLRSAMRKLGGHTRLETVVAARRAGLLP